MLRCQILCHVLKAIFYIKIALKLSYFCQKMQNFHSSYVYGVFGAQRSRDCTVTVLVSQIKRGHVTALSQ